MTNFIVLFSALVLGYLCRRTAHFSAASAATLNAFVVYVSLPALILFQFPTLLSEITFDRALLVPISMAWIHFALAAAFIGFIARKKGWSRAVTGALILTAGLGNTSFVGFPLLDALIGPEAIRVGILVDQPGSFFVVSTLGVITGAIYSGGRVTLPAILRRVFSFPPFLAMLFSTLWYIAGTPGLSVLRPAFERLSLTLVPVALFAVGLRLTLNHRTLWRRREALAFGLGFKLLLAPIFFALFYFYLLHQRHFAAQVTVLESAMAPMITSAVVAAEFKLDDEIANLMVSIGILISLLTVPLWHLAIARP